MFSDSISSLFPSHTIGNTTQSLTENSKTPRPHLHQACTTLHTSSGHHLQSNADLKSPQQVAVATVFHSRETSLRLLPQQRQTRWLNHKPHSTAMPIIPKSEISDISIKRSTIPQRQIIQLSCPKSDWYLKIF